MGSPETPKNPTDDKEVNGAPDHNEQDLEQAQEDAAEEREEEGGYQ